MENDHPTVEGRTEGDSRFVLRGEAGGAMDTGHLEAQNIHRPGPAEDGHAGPLAVDVRGLVKSYADTPVVRGIDLAIRQGEVFALLGPNGAGKTTTIEIL